MAVERRVISCLAIWLLVATRCVSAASPVDGPYDNAPDKLLERATRSLAAGDLTAHDTAYTLFSRGLAYEMLGQRDEALADFTRAITSGALLREEQVRVLYDRGVTLDELNRTEDAIGDYSGALRLAPAFAAALNNRANAYRRLGRLAEARRDYEASISAGNDHPEYPDYGLGQIAEASGHLGAARTYYRAALAANPQFAMAAERMAALATYSTSDGPSALILLRPPGQREAANTMHVKNSLGFNPSLLLKPAINEPGVGPVGAIQLGAWRSEGEANTARTTFLVAAGDILAGLSPRIIAVDLPRRGRYYRLRIDNLDPKTRVRLCGALKAKALACLAVRS